jgi:predicted dehydrogenase
MVMSKTFRVGVIGCGKRARSHVVGLKAESRCEVVAVADLNQAGAEDFAGQFSEKPSVYTDYHRLLEQENPDVIIGCLWPGLHYPVFKDCVEAGVKAYHSEKPMAPTWGDCLAMAELAKTSGTQLTFCHQRRFSEAQIEIRKLIQGGLLGDIKRLDIVTLLCLLDCGTHSIDQALSYIGESPAKWVFGAVDITEPKELFGVQSESLAIGKIVFENGVCANLECGSKRHTDLMGNTDLYQGVRVCGDKGMLEIGWGGEICKAAIYDDPQWQAPQIESDKGEKNSCIRMVNELFDALESGRESAISHQKALRATEIIFGLYESARRRTRVDFPLTITDNPFAAMISDCKCK